MAYILGEVDTRIAGRPNDLPGDVANTFGCTVADFSGARYQFLRIRIAQGKNFHEHPEQASCCLSSSFDGSAADIGEQAYS
ncbi:MAG: hypothetical protein KGJ06_08455 [Pseudomonadota bacterium]|nr:hypothetical protein [Pseudomonadota bacterium]